MDIAAADLLPWVVMGKAPTVCVAVPLSFDSGAFHLVFLPSPFLHLRVLHGCCPVRQHVTGHLLAPSAIECNGPLSG